jgi:hypothetical protein
VLGNVIQSFVEGYVHLYETNNRTLEMLQDAGFELPRELRAAAEFALSSRFVWAIAGAHRSLDPVSYRRAVEIADEAMRRGYAIDMSSTSTLLADLVCELVTSVMRDEGASRVKEAIAFVELAQRLCENGHLARAQELFYDAFEQRVDWPEDVARLGLALGFGTTHERRLSTVPKESPSARSVER